MFIPIYINLSGALGFVHKICKLTICYLAKLTAIVSDYSHMQIRAMRKYYSLWPWVTLEVRRFLHV